LSEPRIFEELYSKKASPSLRPQALRMSSAITTFDVATGSGGAGDEATGAGLESKKARGALGGGELLEQASGSATSRRVIALPNVVGVEGVTVGQPQHDACHRVQQTSRLA